MLDGSHPRYVPSGHIVFAGENSLWAAPSPFDAARLEVLGPPVPLVNDFNRGAEQLKAFAIADTGTLVYVRGSPTRGRTLAWVDRAGSAVVL